MKYKVGDIVKYYTGQYGVVVKYVEMESPNKEDEMRVLFFHMPHKTFSYYLNPGMRSCWSKVD